MKVFFWSVGTRLRETHPIAIHTYILSKPIEDTRTPSDMDFEFYFFSPLKMGMSIGIPELYGFEFGKGKIRPRPVAMPS
jgi:hypothetical protein